MNGKRTIETRSQATPACDPVDAAYSVQFTLLDYIANTTRRHNGHIDRIRSPRASQASAPDIVIVGSPENAEENTVVVGFPIGNPTTFRLSPAIVSKKQ